MSNVGEGEARDGVYDMWTRRSYLVATAGLAALAGCSEGDGAETTTTTAAGMGDGRTPPEGVSQDAFVNGPVPDVYVSASTLTGEQRAEGDLFAQGDVQYARYETATANSAHEPGRSCGNCGQFVHDRNGDGFGACGAVVGYVHRGNWCTVYESLPEPAVPEDMTEDDLATAEVPDEYRTAASQVGETRTPEELESQESAGLTESVEAIEDGAATPGESCGNCAEFIRDKNGDGWGACARVEGYIAVEDWCERWEHVSAEL
jgi:hypothetical protein